jgi:acyl-coenzyme A synthetase/AMP-(fatty) acid ligase
MTGLRKAIARLWDIDDSAEMLQYEGDWVRWGAIRTLAERIDEELAAAGCAVGGRLAVVLDNSVESVAALLAVIRGGRTLVTLSPLQPPERLGADLEASGVNFVLAGRIDWEKGDFVQAVSRVGASGWMLDRDGVTLRTEGTRTAEAARSGDVVVEMLTSGSTGPPKRIPLTRRQLEASLQAVLTHNDQTGGVDRQPLTGAVALVTWPIVHISGMWNLLQALVSARRLVLFPRFDLSRWHAAIKEHRPAVVGLPPPAIRAVLESGIPRYDLSSVRAINCGASPIDPDLVDAFQNRYGIPILIVYGATEFSGAIAGWTLKSFQERWNEKRGSVGKAFPGVRLQVVDAAGDVLPAGRTGRLRVASPQVGLAADQWITTSDLAHLDEDGFLYIDGRADGVIVRGGFKVSPDVVVRSLCTHPDVQDGAVVGLPDERLGHIPVAAVELRMGASATPEQLREHCRITLTPYEVPADVFIVDELPRGSAMKVDQRRLAEMVTGLRLKAKSE